MRTPIVYICLLLTFCLPLFAEHVNTEKAKQVASSFLSGKSLNTKGVSPLLQLSHTAYLEDNLRSENSSVGYYAFSVGNNEGFVIIAGNDLAYPVLGYSDQGNFDESELPPNARYWLEGYCQEIKDAIRKEYTPTTEIQYRWAELLSGKTSPSSSEGKLLKTALWGQDGAFNAQCPKKEGELCLAGCTATALGIIMEYYQWPKKGRGTHTYYSKSLKEAVTADFNVEYNWKNMLADYRDGFTDAQQKAVSTLLYHIGVAIEMNYGTDASSAFFMTENIKKYFDYHKAGRWLQKECYADNEWTTMLKEEINKDRPVYYSGSSFRVGHSFVCDGYDNTNLFHFNWGWHGKSNGYFSLTSLDPKKEYDGYRIGQGMALNFVPSTHEAKETFELRIGRARGTGYGMTIDADMIEQRKSFYLEVNSLVNVGSRPFDGYIGLALTESGNNILDILARFKWDASTTIMPGLWSNCWFRTEISISFMPTDKLRIIYSEDQVIWKVMEGGTQTTNEIGLGLTIPKFHMVIPPQTKGAIFIPLEGYDSYKIEKGNHFKFRLKLEEEYKEYALSVHCNGVEIQPENDIYTINNINEDQKLKVELTKIITGMPDVASENRIRAYVANRVITIYQAPLNNELEVYHISGKLVGRYLYKGSPLQIKSPERGIYLIKGDKETIRVVI